MTDRTALVVIDVQVAMFHDSEPVHDAARLLETIQYLISQARSLGTPVIYVQHNEGAGEPLESGTPGWNIHPEIAPDADDQIVQKHTPDSFHETNLQDVLRDLGVHRLILAGIQTEMCVDTTCRRAFSLGYDVVLVKDAHSTWGNGRISAEDIIDHHNKTLRWFAAVTDANEVEFA